MNVRRDKSAFGPVIVVTRSGGEEWLTISEATQLRDELSAAMGETTPALPAGAAEWLRSGERGISSNAIFTHLTGLPEMGRWSMRTPADPADLRRCRLLLEAVPALRAGLPRMAEVSAAWAALIQRWDELCATMDEECPEWREGRGEAPRTYEMMQEIERSVRR